jgi:threonylcarbamoyladenosine tRNA methylthiotransferase MtaB
MVYYSAAMNICFDTFGCRLNRAEALEDEARCRARGHTIVDNHADADLIVVRGCSVTARAQRDCEHLIERLRAKYPVTRLIVTGCLPDARKFDVSRLSPGRPDKDDPVPTRTARAYLKIQDGCSCSCTFCIVPKFRGTSRSVPFADVLERARRFIDAGYRELVVTGCNLSLYVSDGRRLPELATALAALSPDCRIRFGSVEPGAVARDLVPVMADTPNICRFLHLSVQSGSDRMLTAMRRPYTARDVDTLARDAVRRMPLIGLGCDLIAGFPAESEIDFRLTKGLLERHPFSNVHAFPYSERPGTVAAGLPGALSTDLRRARAHALADIAAAHRRRFLNRFIGRTVDIVVERDSRCAGWTGEYLWLEDVRQTPTSAKHVSRRKERLLFTVRSVRDGQLLGEEAQRGR